jgi:hypothetical protein
MVEKDFYIFKINPTTITGVSREEFSILKNCQNGTSPA